MASTGVNVLRYSALGAGVIYGVWHQSKLSAAARDAAAHQEYKHKQTLIAQAKAEYAKSKGSASSGGNAVLDLSDPKFDLEAFLMKVT
ncbi:hypothetical protein K3495_g1891 [Podosphaera aphanis]|nr:hypothetical protein K3495_g1891 [Podosphaera aphanis]